MTFGETTRGARHAPASGSPVSRGYAGRSRRSAPRYTPRTYRDVAAEKTGDAVPVPQPDETPADQSLARTLQKTGLQFRGVELIAAP